ncbi:hypothetical protein [Priestia sp. YIM B13551]|uniref:hypothetical protein n=1 Tax=Priestia sp. YIM B13551 TaxID=3366306 RepID=UPI00366C7755
MFEYQAGSTKAGLELIQSFGYDPETKKLSNFIKKYFNLLRYGVINFRDKETRKLIAKYTPNKDLQEELVPFYQYAHTKKGARKVVQMINFRLRHLSDEELINILCMLLLTQAKRYKKKSDKINFCGYLKGSYYHSVHEYFKYLYKDLSYGFRIESLEDHIDENSEIQIKDSWYQDLYFEKENQELGFNWILGKTATFPFDQLTTFERTLISLYDHKGMTYEQVGAHMGYHRDTIWSKRKQIKKKLKELMKIPPCN